MSVIDASTVVVVDKLERERTFISHTSVTVSVTRHSGGSRKQI